MLLVERHVEQRAAVVGPGEAALGFPDAVGPQRAAGEILHSDAIALGASAVDGVGQQPMVVTMPSGSARETARALGLAVAVRKHPLPPPRIGWAAAQPRAGAPG